MEYLSQTIVSLPELLVGLFCVWIIGGALYRLQFSPIQQITEEALVLEGVGTDSTGQALEAGTVFILSRPDVAQRLKEDLVKAIPDPDKIPPFTKLREPDYLVSKKDQYTGLI